MIINNVSAILENGNKYDVLSFRDIGSGMFEFSIFINGKETEFMYICENRKSTGKWFERDLIQEAELGEDRIYKPSTIKFARLEHFRILK